LISKAVGSVQVFEASFDLRILSCHLGEELRLDFDLLAAPLSVCELSVDRVFQLLNQMLRFRGFSCTIGCVFFYKEDHVSVRTVFLI